MIYWWGCCLSSFPVVGKQCHFASSALLVRGKAIGALPSNLHDVSTGSPTASCLLTVLQPPASHLLQPLLRFLVSALSHLNPLTLKPFISPSTIPERICASLWKQVPLFPAGCTSLFQLPFYQALVLFVLDSQYADRTVPIYREKYGSLWGKNQTSRELRKGLSCRSGTLAKASVFQRSTSKFRIISAKPAWLLCCHPQQRCQWTPQPWRLSFLLSPLHMMEAQL